MGAYERRWWSRDHCHLITERLQGCERMKSIILNPHRQLRRLGQRAFYALIALVLLWGLFPYLEDPQESGNIMSCSVVRIVDGDTVHLDCGSASEPAKLKVRLHCIDAPELDQDPWGDQATAHLASLLEDRVQLEALDTDRYGRTVGRLIHEGVDLNLAMVEDGYAAVYPRYCTESQYEIAESAVRDAGLGIWSEPGLQQRPWEWRRR